MIGKTSRRYASGSTILSERVLTRTLFSITVIMDMHKHSFMMIIIFDQLWVLLLMLLVDFVLIRLQTEIFGISILQSGVSCILNLTGVARKSLLFFQIFEPFIVLTT